MHSVSYSIVGTAFPRVSLRNDPCYVGVRTNSVVCQPVSPWARSSPTTVPRRSRPSPELSSSCPSTVSTTVSLSRAAITPRAALHCHIATFCSRRRRSSFSTCSESSEPRAAIRRCPLPTCSACSPFRRSVPARRWAAICAFCGYEFDRNSSYKQY